MRITEKRLRRIIRGVIKESIGSEKSISLNGVIIDNFEVFYDPENDMIGSLNVSGDINIKETLRAQGKNDERESVEFDYENESVDVEGIAFNIVDQINDLELFAEDMSDGDLDKIESDLIKIIEKRMYDPFIN